MGSASLRRWVAGVVPAAVLAFAWQALLPLATATMQPRTYATLCTSLGVRVVPVDDGRAPPAQAADDHCALCRLAAAGDAPLPQGSEQRVRAAKGVDSIAVDAVDAVVRGAWTPGSPRAPPVA
jgi:hypothetical protein